MSSASGAGFSTSIPVTTATVACATGVGDAADATGTGLAVTASIGVETAAGNTATGAEIGVPPSATSCGPNAKSSSPELVEGSMARAEPAGVSKVTVVVGFRTVPLTATSTRVNPGMSIARERPSVDAVPANVSAS